jgi:hypothetical protein
MPRMLPRNTAFERIKDKVEVEKNFFSVITVLKIE